MIDLLRELINIVVQFHKLVLWAIISAVNLVIAAIGALASAVMDLLPTMPAPPSGPDDNVIGWLLWIVPIGPLLTGLAIFVACWLAYLVIRVPLRWAKVV